MPELRSLNMGGLTAPCPEGADLPHHLCLHVYALISQSHTASTLAHTLWLQQCTRDTSVLALLSCTPFFQLLEQSLVVGVIESTVCHRIPPVTSSVTGLTIPQTDVCRISGTAVSQGCSTKGHYEHLGKTLKTLYFKGWNKNFRWL